jgi:hypothetical protein
VNYQDVTGILDPRVVRFGGPISKSLVDKAAREAGGLSDTLPHDFGPGRVMRSAFPFD